MIKGSHHTPESRAKNSESHKQLGPDYHAWLGARRRGGHNVPVTAEHRANLSAAQKGKPRPYARGNRNVQDAPVKGECAYCLGPATTHDHVIPRGRPGWDDPENVVLACLSCNRAKSNRTPDEWFASDKAS